MSASEKLIEQRDALVLEASTALAGEPTQEANALAESRMAEVEALEGRIATAKKVEERTKAIEESRTTAGVSSFTTASVSVGKEPRTYDRDLRNSWAKDLMMNHLYNDSESRDRLARHAKEERVENRAMSTTATAGGEFAPPAYLLADYAEFARASRVVANLVTNEVLPEGVPSIKIPQITTGTKTAFQGGNNATATTRDEVTAYVTAPAQTISGYNDVSIQLIEQSPVNLDAMIFGDLTADYALTLNTGVSGNTDGTANNLLGLTYQGITNGTLITWTETTPSQTGFIGAMGKGLSAIANLRFKDAEAIVMSPSTWYYLSSLVDTTGRPVFAAPSTAWNPLLTTGNLGKVSGLVGIYGAGVPVFVDATIPKTVNTNQAPILIGKFSDSYLYESAQKAGIFPDVGSANLTVRYRLYGYVAFANRFAKSLAAVTGTGTAVQAGF